MKTKVHQPILDSMGDMDAFPNWKEVELLTAALHHEESDGATVTWNDKIKGRQFDVTVRFTHSGYAFLTVIECKKEKARVAVKEVEAFVTKSRHVHANKAVMVSRSGYQSGAIDVAKKEDIVLLNLVDRKDGTPRVDGLTTLAMLKHVETGEHINIGIQPAVAELLDSDVRDALAKRFALVDLDGNTVVEAFLTDLRLGQWREIEVGKFYRRAVGGYYFCEAITSGVIHWILVESYQHGQLLQLRFEQSQEHGSQYHHVTDKHVLRRLRTRLFDYLGRHPKR